MTCMYECTFINYLPISKLRFKFLCIADTPLCIFNIIYNVFFNFTPSSMDLISFLIHLFFILLNLVDSQSENQIFNSMQKTTLYRRLSLLRPSSFQNFNNNNELQLRKSGQFCFVHWVAEIGSFLKLHFSKLKFLLRRF